MPLSTVSLDSNKCVAVEAFGCIPSYRDLSSWMHEMSVLLKSEELAKDVAGAEALLQRHNEHKVSF